VIKLNETKSFFDDDELDIIIRDHLGGVIAVYGEYGTGKSLFGLSCPLEPKLVIDNHGSTHQYADIIDFSLKNVDDRNFFETIKEIKVSQNHYGMIMLESMEIVQDWLFGFAANRFSASQKEKMKGLVWGETKRLMTNLILDLKKKCDILVITAHTKSEWVGNKPTGRKEAKFLEPVWDLSYIVAYLHRGKSDIYPTGCVDPQYGKTRKIHILDGTIYPVFPPLISPFTWSKLAYYINSPADYKNLKDYEKSRNAYELIEKLSKISEAETPNE